MPEISNSTGPDSKIVYPRITVPGKGTFTVKYGMGASFTLEDELGMDDQAVFAELMKLLPVTDPQTNEVLQPGRVNKSFLLKVLSACLWDQIHLTPRELADAFGTWDTLPEIARVVLEALSKTQWSAKLSLQEPATTQQGPLPN